MPVSRPILTALCLAAALAGPAARADQVIADDLIVQPDHNVVYLAQTPCLGEAEDSAGAEPVA